MKKLRVNHYPQITCDPFFVDVKDEEQAYLVEKTLADQHLFLYDNNFIPDYSNAICVLQWNEEDKEWEDYYNEDKGLDWEEYVQLHFKEAV